MFLHKYQKQNLAIDLDKLLFQYDPYKKTYQSNECYISNQKSIHNNIEIKFETISNKLDFLNTFQSIKIIGDYLDIELTKSVNIFETKDLLLSAEPYIKLSLSKNNGYVRQYRIIFETKNIFTLGEINLSLIYTEQTHHRSMIKNKPNKIAFRKVSEQPDTFAFFNKEHGKILNDLKCYYMVIQDLPIICQIGGGGELEYIAIPTTTQNVCIISNKATCYRISVIDTFGNEQKFIDCFDIFEIDAHDINNEKYSTHFEYDEVCVFKKKKNKKLFFRFRQFNFDNSECTRPSYISNEIITQQIREKYNINWFFSRKYQFPPKTGKIDT